MRRWESSSLVAVPAEHPAVVDEGLRFFFFVFLTVVDEVWRTIGRGPARGETTSRGIRLLVAVAVLGANSLLFCEVLMKYVA